jgi:hypothetical protein
MVARVRRATVCVSQFSSKFFWGSFMDTESETNPGQGGAKLRPGARVWHPAQRFERCPRCREVFPGARGFNECWIERPLSNDWMQAVRLAVQDGRPVIAELRIFPAPKWNEQSASDKVLPAEEPGCWAVEWLGDRAKIPPGGLPARGVVREAQTHVILENLLRPLMEQWESWMISSYRGPKELIGSDVDPELPLTPRGLPLAAALGPKRRGGRPRKKIARDS